MQPNMIGAETIAHRARFAWLGLALAATIALFAASASRGSFRARPAGPGRIEKVRSMPRCGGALRFDPERRARIEAERARRAAERSERIERVERRAAERAERAERRARLYD